MVSMGNLGKRLATDFKKRRRQSKNKNKSCWVILQLEYLVLKHFYILTEERGFLSEIVPTRKFNLSSPFEMFEEYSFIHLNIKIKVKVTITDSPPICWFSMQQADCFTKSFSLKNWNMLWLTWPNISDRNIWWLGSKLCC